MKLLLFIGALASFHLVSSQCTSESLDNSMVADLLARSLVAGTQSASPTVTVRDYTIVCLAVSTTIDQYRFASVVVSYDCTGTCPGGTSGVLSQVEFGCNNNAWSEVVAGTSEGNIQHSPEATFQTSLRSDCHTCINPGRESTSMEPNHCISCSGCLPPDQGLNMCTGIGASQCCNVNITGQCRQSCTPGTVTDPNFICRASCGDQLPTALYQTGVLDDSACTYAGCTATYRCNDGLKLSDLTSTSYQLSCLGSGSTAANWDVNTRTCSQQCNFTFDKCTTSRGFMIEYDPPGCDSTFGTTDCNATYTYDILGNYSCSCIGNDTTGEIRCDVPYTCPNGTINDPSPTDPTIPLYGIVLIVLGAILLVIIAVIITVIICYFSIRKCKENKVKATKEKEKEKEATKEKEKEKEKVELKKQHS